MSVFPRENSGAGNRLALIEAARAMVVGAVVAYPTEAVYGLGCDPWNEQAVRRLLTLKRRSRRKGLILIASSLSQLSPFLAPIEPLVRKRLQADWPGAVTWLLRARSGVPPWLTGDHGAGQRRVAVRVTAHPIAAGLCRRFDGAVVSTSANRAGRPACRTGRCVRRVFGSEVDVLVGGAVGGSQRPSRIVDGVSGEVIRR